MKYRNRFLRSGNLLKHKLKFRVNSYKYKINVQWIQRVVENYIQAFRLPTFIKIIMNVIIMVI